MLLAMWYGEFAFSVVLSAMGASSDHTDADASVADVVDVCARSCIPPIAVDAVWERGIEGRE